MSRATPEQKRRYLNSAKGKAWSARYYHARNLRKKYGITPEQYAAMFKSQGGRCLICRRPPMKYRLAVDHCHRTSIVRGLLCLPCNRYIGWVGEDVTALQRAIDYLNKFKEAA